MNDSMFSLELDIFSVAIFGFGMTSGLLFQFLKSKFSASSANYTSKRTFLLLLDSIDDLVWIKDLDSRFVYVNRKFGEVFDVDPSSIVGKTDFDLSAADLAAKYFLDDQMVIQKRQLSRSEEKVSLSSGNLGWSETVKVPLVVGSGQVIGTAGVARDITERRQMQDLLEARVSARTKELSATLAELRSAQDKLVSRQKMSALGSLVVGIAHELNTPIGNSLVVASTICDEARQIQSQLIDGALSRTSLVSYFEHTKLGTDVLIHESTRIM